LKKLTHRRIRLLAVLASFVAGVAPGACNRPARRRAVPAPQSVAQYPRAADRLIRLVRRQLSDENPARTEQEVVCETERMAATLGYKEAALRVRTALDTAYLTARDSTALGRVERLLGGRSFGDGNHVCDSLIAAANREEPIVPEKQAKP